MAAHSLTHSPNSSKHVSVNHSLTQWLQHIAISDLPVNHSLIQCLQHVSVNHSLIHWLQHVSVNHSPNGSCTYLFLQFHSVARRPRCVAFAGEAKVQRECISALNHIPKGSELVVKANWWEDAHGIKLHSPTVETYCSWHMTGLVLLHRN